MCELIQSSYACPMNYCYKTPDGKVTDKFQKMHQLLQSFDPKNGALGYNWAQNGYNLHDVVKCVEIMDHMTDHMHSEMKLPLWEMRFIQAPKGKEVEQEMLKIRSQRIREELAMKTTWCVRNVAGPEVPKSKNFDAMFEEEMRRCAKWDSRKFSPSMKEFVKSELLNGEMTWKCMLCNKWLNNDMEGHFASKDHVKKHNNRWILVDNTTPVKAWTFDGEQWIDEFFTS